MTADEFDEVLAQRAARSVGRGDQDDRRGAARRAAALAAQLAEREAQLGALQRRLEIMEREGPIALRSVERSAGEAARAAEASASERDAALRALDAVREQHQAERAEVANARSALEQAFGRAGELERQVAQLRQEREGIEQAARVARAEQQARIRELEQLVSSLLVTLAATRRDVERAEASRAWRLGHRMMRTANLMRGRRDKTQGALVSAIRRIDDLERATRALPAAEPEPPPAAAAPEREEPESPARSSRPAEVAAEIRGRLGEPPALDAWPPVSIVVANRNGQEQLGRLVTGLREHTDYPEAELVVVDKGSSDASAAWLATCDPGMPVRLVASDDDVSCADANAQGLAAASHDHVVFLGDDVEPFERGWLRELLAAHVRGRHALTGATLLHGERTSAAAADGTLVRHRGIRLRRGADGVLPHDDGDGGDLFDAAFGVDLPAAAVSDACLLVQRATFDSLGGFSRRYRHGLEDVDLGMRATAAGLAVAVSGRAVLYHHESVTRTAVGSDFTSARRDTDRRAWLERWAAEAGRAYRVGRLERDSLWTDGAGPHVAITVTSLEETAGRGDWHTAHELGAALEQLAWRVTYLAVEPEGRQQLPADADYVLALLDGFDARAVPAAIPVIAWIHDRTDRWLERPWFERIDVLLASSTASCDLVEERTGRRPLLFYEHRANALVRILREQEERQSFCIKIGAPDWQQAERWGDLHFARALAGELRRRGHRSLIQVLGEWEELEGHAYDVVVHLKGRGRHFVKSGQVNVLWCISHPAELTAEECDGYDLVCVASARFAEDLRRRTTIEILVLEQATDPAAFYPDPDPDRSSHHDLVYVANSRGVLRSMMRDLLPTDRDLAVYGSGWEGLIDTKHVVAEHVPNDRLRQIYSSASIVLADHWEDMRERGFISNRIYDALACGACVISDDVAGLDERFGGAVATYSSPKALQATIARLLADPAERAAMGERGRAAILEGGLLRVATRRAHPRAGASSRRTFAELGWRDGQTGRQRALRARAGRRTDGLPGSGPQDRCSSPDPL